MGRTKSLASIAMEVFIEQWVISEMLITLQNFIFSEHGTFTLFILPEDANEPGGKIIGNFT
jgi:hypothetical protein